MLAGRLSPLRSLRRGYLHAFSIPRQGCGCVSQVCDLLMMWRQGIIGYRGQILHFLDDPKAVREDKTSFVLFLIDDNIVVLLLCTAVRRSRKILRVFRRRHSCCAKWKDPALRKCDAGTACLRPIASDQGLFQIPHYAWLVKQNRHFLKFELKACRK